MSLNKKILEEINKLVWSSPKKLFTAGPVACFPEVLEAMKIQMFSHRSKEYRALHKDTIERLEKFLEVKEGKVLLFPSSGTGIMEASIRNFVQIKGNVLVTIIGAFGERYKEVVEAKGRKAITLVKNPGDPVFPDDLEEALVKNPEVEAVTITYNETSTGVLNPLKELSYVAKKHGKLVFVDAVSAMGAAEIKFDEWGMDVVFSSSQKAFGLPPGLAIGVFSKEALKKAEKITNRGWYFDVLEYVKTQEEEWSTPSTPPIPQIIGLNVILRMIEEMGGKKQWLNMYNERAEMIRNGVKRLGLEIFARRGYESPTITCVKVPVNIDGYEIYERMRKRGYELAAGYGPFKKTTFRIGHMGYITKEDIEGMLNNLAIVLEEMLK